MTEVLNKYVGESEANIRCVSKKMYLVVASQLEYKAEVKLGA